MGFHQITAVDQRRECCNDLNTGAVKCLSKRHGCQFCRTNTFFAMELTSCFTGQVNASIITETKFSLVFVEFICPQQICNLDNAHITGLRHNLFYIDISVTAYQVTFDAVTADVCIPITLETGVWCNNTFLQCSCYQHGFENRPGFVGIADTEVFPHGIQVFQLFFTAELIPVFCILGICFPFGDFIWIIQVEGMGFCHGINFTCIRVHNHSCHVFRGPFRRCFCHHFFRNLLDIIVDGGDDGIPVFCIIILMDNGICAIVKDERPSRGSFHIAVVISFQSPLCVTTGKTNQMAGGTVQRIRAFTAFFKINAFQVHGFQFFFHTALNTFHKVFPMVIHIQFPSFRINGYILFQCVVIQFWEIFAKSG